MFATNPVTIPDSTFSESEREKGSVLLSFDGRMMKLNSVGTVIWDVLYSNKKVPGFTEAELLTLVTQRLERLVENPIPRETIHKDLKQFLSMLVQRRLIVRDTDGSGVTIYRPAKDVVWSGQHDHKTPAIRHTLNKQPAHQQTAGRLMTLKALLWLFAYSLFLRTGGFERIRGIIQLAPFESGATRDKESERETCRHICTAVDRAQTFLLRHALCLQRSIVITRLLQERGVDAETVIAAHLMPFKSHAWVEVDGEVVSDSPNVQRYYDVVIERLGRKCGRNQ